VDRLTSLQSVSVGLSADAPSTWAIPWSRLLPLWRHAAFLLALFVVLAVAAWIRLDVQRLQVDLDRNDRETRRALVLHERLSLELEARTRMAAVQAWSTELGASADTPVVHLREDP
jgi:cyanate permease